MSEIPNATTVSDNDHTPADSPGQFGTSDQSTPKPGDHGTGSGLYSSNFRNAQDANYTPSGDPRYQDNPLIEAILPILSAEDIMGRATYLPEPPDSVVRGLPRWERRDRLPTIYDGYVCTSRVASRIERMLSLQRQGYIGRNPVKRGFWKKLGQLPTEVKAAMHDRTQVTYARADYIVGLSGTGKTSLVRNGLALLPQVIDHSRSFEATAYQLDSRMPTRQVTHLMVTCSTGATLRQFCASTLRALGDVTGTHLARRANALRATADDLLDALVVGAVTHHLGVLVVDEIQNLQSAKFQNSQELLRFFVAFQERLKIPVVLVGTPDAAHVLHHNISFARRGVGPEWVRYEPHQADYEDWNQYVKTLWCYQYTAKHVEPTPELLETFNYWCQGVMDFAATLFILAQHRAIESGVEEVTREILESVAKDSLFGIREAIEGLASGDESRLQKYEDAVGVLRAKANQTLNGAHHATDVSPVTTSPTPNVESPHNKQPDRTRRSKRLSKGGLIDLFRSARTNKWDVYDCLVDYGFIKRPAEMLE